MLEELKKVKAEIVAIEQGLSSFDMLREKLKKDFNLDGIKERLLSIPKEIADIQQKAQGTRQQMPDIETQMKGIEADLTFKIGMEENGAEKPKLKFSNAESRKAELTNRLKVNKEYITLKVEKSSLEFESINFDIEVDKLRRTFQANLAIKDLIAAEMNLYRR